MKQEILLKKVYQKLSKDKNYVAIDYLFEILCLSRVFYFLINRYQKSVQYIGQNNKNGKNNNDAIYNCVIIVEDLVYRYYSLLEKLAQFINNVWLSQKFAESECSFVKIRGECKYKKYRRNERITLINKELDRLDIKSVNWILEERRSLVHRKIVGGRGSEFCSSPLLFEGESAKSFKKWSNHSYNILNRAYERIFEIIDSLLFLALKDI